MDFWTWLSQMERAFSHGNVNKYPLYLNGELRQVGQSQPVINPATGEAFATMSLGSRALAAQAIQDAASAFQGWRQMPGKSRGELLHKIAAELQVRRDELARLITLENGKPLTQSQGEISMAVEYLRWFGEEARRIYGEVIPHQVEEKRHFTFKYPVGVVGAISPWNFPLALAVRKIAPALAAGCPVILKPSSRAPLSASVLAECVNAVKLPNGVFQLVTGPAAEIAKEFLENPICRKISFTGSTAVGKKLIEGAARQVKRLSLELGGNSPVLVFEDAVLETAVSGALVAKFRNSGQSCLAANRIFVHRSLYDSFLKAFTQEVRALRLGDGMDPASQVGPLIDENALIRAQEHVDDAVRGGAKVLCGGNRMDRKGYFYVPTVLGDVPRGSLCMFEETFAPVAPVSPFDDEAEVLELANHSIYGLGAYVFTRDMARVFRLSDSLDAGVIGVNDPLPTASQAPFGGLKQSGWGRELGREGMDSFLETKHLSIGL
jgi:succinate-semialdehyde dehydrogenase/glutarate-semialdehyde dehydrogenase